MPKVRAYGTDSTLKACRETTYGTAPTSGYRGLDFKSTDLSAAIPLGDDPLLGRGRNAQGPYRELITDQGSVDIPLDVEGTERRWSPRRRATIRSASNTGSRRRRVPC